MIYRFQSFTQMFVKFLETESVPHQTPRLPAAAMVNEAQQKRRPLSHSGLCRFISEREYWPLDSIALESALYLACSHI